MYDRNRKIEELLADYAEALRNGNTPIFLRSLVRQEGQAMRSSPEFREAAEFSRILNWLCFADRAATPTVDLFISRTNTRIRARMKQCRRPRKRRTRAEKTQTPHRLQNHN